MRMWSTTIILQYCRSILCCCRPSVFWATTGDCLIPRLFVLYVSLVVHCIELYCIYIYGFQGVTLMYNCSFRVLAAVTAGVGEQTVCGQMMALQSARKNNK